jgi:hypothetical protein
MHKCTYVFKLLYKEEPDDGSCEPKHVALCDMTQVLCWKAYFPSFMK